MQITELKQSHFLCKYKTKTLLFDCEFIDAQVFAEDFNRDLLHVRCRLWQVKTSRCG